MRLIWDHFGFREPNGGIASYANHVETILRAHGIIPERVAFPEDLPSVPSKILSKKPAWLSWLAMRWLPSNVTATESAVFHGLANFNMPLVSKSRWPNLRFFLTVHDIIPLLTRPNSALSLQMKWLLPKRLRRCDGVICVSEWSKQTLLDKFGAHLSADKVVVIPHGRAPNESRISSAGENALRAGVLFVSRWEPYKGFETLFALMRSGGEGFTVVTNAEGRNRVAAFLTSEPGLTAKVRVLSEVSRDELLKLYDSHEMLLQPSWYEGFGFPVQEALLRSCPVIYRKGSAMDGFGEGLGVVAMSRNSTAEDWRVAMERLKKAKNSDELYSSCGRHLQSWPTWEDVYHKLFSIYSLQKEPRTVQ